MLEAVAPLAGTARARPRSRSVIRPTGQAGVGDPLGLRGVLGGPRLVLTVAAMAFLAGIALVAAGIGWRLAVMWRGTAEITVEIPDAAPARVEAALALLHGRGWSAARLSPDAVAALLRPWLGSDGKLPDDMPAIIAARPGPSAINRDALKQALLETPGAILEDHADWSGRLDRLVQAAAAMGGLIALAVTVAAIATTALAVRAALAARAETVAVVHGLGAPDGFVARAFARRTRRAAALGGLIGVVLSLPPLAAVAVAAGLLFGEGRWPVALAPGSTVGLLAALTLPVGGAWLLGHVTAHITVRQWLARLP